MHTHVSAVSAETRNEHQTHTAGITAGCDPNMGAGNQISRPLQESMSS